MTVESRLLVSNLPMDKRPGELKKCLARLSTNCGGRKININLSKGEAIIRFVSPDDARRCQQRLQSLDVFGRRIEAILLCSNEPESDDTSDSSIPAAITMGTARPSTPEPRRRLTNGHNGSIQPHQGMPLPYRPRNYSQSTPPSPNHQIQELMAICSTHSHSNGRSVNVYTAQRQLLPMINMTIPLLAKRLHHLLDTHAGCLPLNSFADCYTAEFNELFDTTTRPMVALDHLITCVPGVCISFGPSTHVKQITWIPNRRDPSAPDSDNIQRQSYGQNLSHFGREVRELLKCQPHASIPFNQFVPRYHTHFVRQLCVGHYGCLRLADLLAEVSHIVHVYGEGDARVITLTHREQTKRFATDLIKVLKSQNGGGLKLSDFPAAYQRQFGRQFDVSVYGVCYLEDILRDVWEGTVIIGTFGSSDRWIELPRRERSADQKRKTAAFTQDVIELLKCSREVIDFRLTFSMFIPCYHRYFDKQCRVGDYGFTKLIELLEELSPKVIEIIDADEDPDGVPHGEKQLRLSYDNRLKALISRFETILRQSTTHSHTIVDFERNYRRKYLSAIDYTEYYSRDLIDLVDKMPANKFRILKSLKTTRIALMNTAHFRSVAKKMVRLLMEESNAQLDWRELESRYLQQFGDCLTQQLLDDYRDVFITEWDSQRDCIGAVRLTEMFLFARNCIQCLQSGRKRRYTLDELDREYTKQFGEPLPQPTFFKCCNFAELFAKFFDIFHVESKRIGPRSKPTLMVTLDLNYAKRPLDIKPPVYQILRRQPLLAIENSTDCPPNGESTLKVRPGIIDLFDDDLPECLPLPDLVPLNGVQSSKDLINLSSDVSSSISTDRQSLTDLMDMDILLEDEMGLQTTTIKPLITDLTSDLSDKSYDTGVEEYIYGAVGGDIITNGCANSYRYNQSNGSANGDSRKLSKRHMRLVALSDVE